MYLPDTCNVFNPSCNFAISLRSLSLYDTMIAQKKRLYCLLGINLHKGSGKGIKNKSEEKYLRIVHSQLSQVPNVQILNNIYLHGFECDIVIRKTSIANGKEIITDMNIELDGPSHNRPNRRRFCQLRDDYLSREHGVIIKRFELQRLQSSSFINTIKKLINISNIATSRSLQSGLHCPH